MEILRERLKAERRLYSRGKRKTGTMIGCSVISVLMGLPQRALSQYEQGERAPTAASLAKISVFYNVSADYLLGLTDERREVSASPTKNL